MCHERENNKCLHIQEYYMYMYMLFILAYGLLRHVQHCFSYIAISVLLVKEIGVPGEIHQPATIP